MSLFHWMMRKKRYEFGELMLRKLYMIKYIYLYIILAVSMKFSLSYFKENFYVLSFSLDAVSIAAFIATVITAYLDGKH
ncbi:hypothetical protein J2Z45_003479 [Cohnella lubricantis]|nr:hypothetical protein [Cohnella lubricantis]